MDGVCQARTTDVRGVRGLAPNCKDYALATQDSQDTSHTACLLALSAHRFDTARHDRLPCCTASRHWPQTAGQTHAFTCAGHVPLTAGSATQPAFWASARLQPPSSSTAWNPRGMAASTPGSTKGFLALRMAVRMRAQLAMQGARNMRESRLRTSSQSASLSICKHWEHQQDGSSCHRP